MPARWSNKDERQYEHIRKSAKDSGKPAERAKKIAARTVNKKRQSEGRTENKKSQATGKPGKPLKQRTRVELYNLASRLNIKGRSAMKKDELAAAIGRRR